MRLVLRALGLYGIAGVLMIPLMACAKPTLYTKPYAMRETGPTSISMKVYPKLMMRLGHATVVVRIEGDLPSCSGYILAWEDGCTSTLQDCMVPKRAYQFSHNFHKRGPHKIMFYLVDLVDGSKSKIVALGTTDLDIMVPDND